MPLTKLSRFVVDGKHKQENKLNKLDKRLNNRGKKLNNRGKKLNRGLSWFFKMGGDSVFGKLLEEGCFSHVYKHTSADGEVTALKVFKKKKNRPGFDAETFRHEVSIMNIVGCHPNVVRLMEQGIYKGRTLCLFMEYCERGDLFNFVFDNKRIAIKG